MIVLGALLGRLEIGSIYYFNNYSTAMLYILPKITVLDKLIYQTQLHLFTVMSPTN